MAQTNLYKKPIAEQKAFINSCIKKINEALENENLEKITFTEDEIALISDIHGDLFSLMGSMAQCGFKFQEDKFIFYDPEKEEYYYENEEGKYCKYNPNGDPKETGKVIEPQPDDDSNFILSPMADDSEAHPFLCLGDLLDRSPESTAILILLNTVDKFRALQGDHEFDGGINTMYMMDQKEAAEIVPPILADIKSHDKMPINTYSGKGNDVIEYSHAPTTEECITCMFDFLNDYFNGILIIGNNDIDGKIKNEVFSTLDKEFEKHKNLFNKLRLFINNHKDFDYDKIISDGNFTIEELIIIKKVIGDALTKSEINEEGKNRESGFVGLRRFNKLTLFCPGRGGAANVINFYDRFLGSEKGNSICKLCLHGHKDANEVTKYNNNVGIDVRRSEHKNNGTSKANTFVYNKKNGELKTYESKIKRNIDKELEGDVTKSKSITIELKDDKTEKPTDKGETEEKKTIKYDFSNDVKSVQIDEENNIKITFSTYDFYNNKEKEETIIIKQPYDEVDCVGKNAIFAIFANKNNLNINDAKHQEIIDKLIENLFKSDKENDKRDFLNLVFSNCNNIDTIKYILSLEVTKDFVNDNKKNFINAALLNKNILVDHLKDIFFNEEEKGKFNEYLKNNFLNKEEEEIENKNKDKFFSTIIYTDNVELLKYLKDKNLLGVEDYKTLLERAAIHNKMDIFKEISNNKDKYLGKNTFDEKYTFNLLNIFIGNKSEEFIDKILEICDNINFATFEDEYGTEINNFQKLLETAIKTKDKKIINKVYDIFFNGKVSIDEKTSEEGKKEILDEYINTLLYTFNDDSLDINKKNNESLLYLIKKTQGVENTEDIKFDKIKVDFLKELFKIAAINCENILALNIAKHFTENSVEFNKSDINTYLKPALETGDINLIKKVFEICKNDVNKNEFGGIINDQNDSYKWNVLLENSIKSSNKKVGKTIIDEISTIIDNKDNKVNCFMNRNLPRLLKLSIMCDNMGVFDSIINIYRDNAVITRIKTEQNEEEKKSFNDDIFKKNFNNLLDAAIKTGKAEIVDKVVRSYKTVTDEELDNENLRKVDEFEKNTTIKLEKPEKETKTTIKRDPIIWEGIDLTKIEEKIERGELIDNFNENIKKLYSDSSTNYNTANLKLNKIIELVLNNKYYNLLCKLVNNEDLDISSFFSIRFGMKIENLDILKNLINSDNEEHKKAGWKIVFKNLDKFDFGENVKKPKQFNFNELVNDGKVKNSYFYEVFKYTNFGFNGEYDYGDRHNEIAENFVKKLLENNYEKYRENSGKDIELEDNKENTRILAEYFINNKKPEELRNKIIKFLGENKNFVIKDNVNVGNNQVKINKVCVYDNTKDKIEKIDIAYKKNTNHILYDKNIPDKGSKTEYNYYKSETTEREETNKIVGASIGGNILTFNFKEGTKIEDLNKDVNDFINSFDNNNNFYYGPSYLAYAPLQLQNGNKDNIIFECSAYKVINNIIEKSKNPENQGKTFICDNDNEGHCIQVVICNGEKIDFNTIGSSSEGVLHTINQHGANCILASKLFFTAVAQEYLAKKGDFSEFVKDMRELSKFIGENGNKSKEKVNESNPDNSNYKKYHDLIEIAAKANARLLKEVKKQFLGGVDKNFENLARYFGIDQNTIQPTDLSEIVQPTEPVAKVDPVPTTPTAPAPKPKEPAKSAIPPATTTEPKEPNPDPKKDSDPTPDDPVPEPKKALDIKSMPKYLSDRTVEQQEFSLNDFIGKVNTLYKDEKANEDEISFTTDTHGDLVSLMGAAAMCGVKFKEDEFLYYDKVEGVYYEKIGDKYYKYDTMPYTGPKQQGEPVGINMNNIIVVPIPDIKNARDLYHLGDVLDRGTESLTSLLLCEVCGSIKLAQGNHEFATNISRVNEGYEKEFGPIELALARMKLNGRIATGFYSGKGNNVMSYSHIPLTQKHVEGFFNFLNSTYVDLKYFDKSPSVIEALDREFVNQTGNSNLRDKVKSFLITHKNNDFGTIEKVFTKEEMLIIKNVIGDALVKRKIKKDENGKITLVDGGFNNIYSDFKELRPEGHEDDRNVDILNFEDTENEKDVVVVCNGAAGHQKEGSVRNSNGILFCDDTKSAGYNKNFTKATITTLKKGTGEYKNSSCVIKRINNGIDSKFDDIEEETDLKLDKYESSTVVDKNKTTGYDFINDVKKIEIDGDNIAITFRDGKGEKAISFKKDEYKNNLDCNGRNVIFAAVCCEGFNINDNKDFVKSLLGKLKENKDKVEALNYILTNCSDIGLINEFLDLGLKTKQKKSLVPKTKSVGELDVKERLIISVFSNNKIPNDKISEILKKINNNKEYTKEEFDKNFKDHKNKICSIIANPNNLKLYRYLSDNNFLDSSYYKELLNSAIKFDNKEICEELFKNDGKKYIDNFSEEEITKLLSTAIKSEKTEFIEKVFNLYNNIKEKNSKITEIQNDLLLDIAKSKEEVRDCLFNEIKIFETIDINAKDYEGNTLLHYFCSENQNLETIRYLIEEKNADINIENNDKDKAFHLVFRSNRQNFELAKYFIEEKNINLNDDNNNLLFAVIKNYPSLKIINLMVKNGADVNYRNSSCDDNIMKNLTNFFNYIMALNIDELKEEEEKEKILTSFLMEIAKKNIKVNLSKNNKITIKGIFKNNKYFNFELFAKSLGSLCKNYNIELKDIIGDKFNFTGTNEDFGDFIKNKARNIEWKNMNGKKIIELFNICSHKIYELEEKKQKDEREEKRKKENQPPIPPQITKPTKNPTAGQPSSEPNQIKSKPKQETKPNQPQTEDDFEQTYKNLKQEQFKKEIETEFQGKTTEEIKQQKQKEIKNIAETNDIKIALAERIEEHEKKVELVNKITRDEKSIGSGSVNVVNKIKEVKGKPSTKQTALVLKAAKNTRVEDLFNDEDFKNITLDEIEVDGRSYEGFGGTITYNYDNNSDEISLDFEKDGFFMDQLERMGFNEDDEYKEVCDIFKNGGLIFSKQPKIGKEQTLEFMTRFKLSPTDAYSWICQDKGISIKGKNGCEVNSDKLKEVLTSVTETRHAIASATYYAESIKNKAEEQNDNEELNNYKELANFISKHSVEISKKNSVNGLGLNINGVEFKNPIFAAKCLNKILKIIDNKVNGKCKEGEEEVLGEIINNFNGFKNNIEGNKDIILSNCLLKMYGFSLKKAGKKIDNIAKDNVVNLFDF